MPANDPNAYNVKGDPTSGLKKPKPVKKPKIKLRPIGEAKATKELKARLAERRRRAKEK